MNILDALAAFSRAKDAIKTGEAERRARTRAELLALAQEVAGNSGLTPAGVVDKRLDDVLAVTSQASAVREIAKSFGVYDRLHALIEQLEGKRST